MKRKIEEEDFNDFDEELMELVDQVQEVKMKQHFFFFALLINSERNQKWMKWK